MANDKTTNASILEDFLKGKQIGKKLVFDYKTKRMRAASPFDNSNQVLEITPEDMKVSSACVY